MDASAKALDTDAPGAKPGAEVELPGAAGAAVDRTTMSRGPVWYESAEDAIPSSDEPQGSAELSEETNSHLIPRSNGAAPSVMPEMGQDAVTDDRIDQQRLDDLRLELEIRALELDAVEGDLAARRAVLDRDIQDTEADITARRAALESELEALAAIAAETFAAAAEAREQLAAAEARNLEAEGNLKSAAQREQQQLASARQLEESYAELQKREKAAVAQKKVYERKLEAVNARAARQQEVESENEQLKNDLRSARRKATIAERELEDRNQQLEQKTRRLETLKDAIVDIPGLAITSYEIRNWLAEEADHDFVPADVSISGGGPFENKEFCGWLHELGFKTWEASGACDDVEVMIVGRDDWDAEAIEAQIEARGAMGLRIYSQEMFIAAIAVGRDPFESDDAELFAAFADGHPALEYLSELDSPWPEIGHADDAPLSAGEFVDFQVEQSPLHKLDYRVGYSGHLDARRRAILTIAFNGDLPWVHSQAYMDQWGRPRTTRRLQRMAMHIAWLAKRAKYNDSMSLAVREWTEDLDWLKMTFRPRVQTFQWPRV